MNDRDYPTDRPHGINEASQPMGMTAKRERPSRERTKQLLDLAETISILVEEKTNRGERCRLRRMVEMLLDQDG